MIYIFTIWFHVDMATTGRYKLSHFLKHEGICPLISNFSSNPVGIWLRVNFALLHCGHTYLIKGALYLFKCAQKADLIVKVALSLLSDE